MSLPEPNPVVRKASARDASDWDRYLASQDAASFYHLYGWRDVVKSCFSHDSTYLMATNSEKLVGVLPLVSIESRIFGKILCSVPFLNYGGPCAESEQIAALLANSAIELADAGGYDYLELRCASSLQIGREASLRKVSMTIPLNPDPEVVWGRFTPKHRNNIRRAEKNELEVCSGGAELLPEFYALMEQSWRDLGTPLYAVTYFEKIASAFPDRFRIFVCRHHGAAVCAAFNGLYRTTVEGMWAGALPRARNLQANYVLYWEMIRRACLDGFERFHLGRSTVDSGSDQFKRRWNAEAHQLHWYFHRPEGGPMPQLNVDNTRFRLAIQTWRHLPLWLVRRLGPALARSIP